MLRRDVQARIEVGAKAKPLAGYRQTGRAVRKSRRLRSRLPLQVAAREGRQAAKAGSSPLRTSAAAKIAAAKVAVAAKSCCEGKGCRGKLSSQGAAVKKAASIKAKAIAAKGPAMAKKVPRPRKGAAAAKARRRPAPRRAAIAKAAAEKRPRGGCRQGEAAQARSCTGGSPRRPPHFAAPPATSVKGRGANRPEPEVLRSECLPLSSQASRARGPAAPRGGPPPEHPGRNGLPSPIP